MLTATEKAKTPAEAVFAFEALLKIYGFSFHVVARHARPDPMSAPSIKASRAPEGWLETYTRLKLATIDPILRHLAVSDRPFRWRAALVALAKDPNVGHWERAMAEASRFGLEDGYAFPIHSSDSLDGFVSIGGPSVDLSPTELDLLEAGARRVYRTLRGFDEPGGPVSSGGGADRIPVFTKRELDVLVHLADGHTSGEIGDRLKISRHTVDWYITGVQGKLKARNRLHAVSITLRMGLIR